MQSKAIKLNIKPLSVNDAWQGRRFRSKEYNRYIRDMLRILPAKMAVPPGKIEIYLKFGFSSASSDFDNPVKPFVDCLQKKYGFNDKEIKRGVIEVENVKKGHEFVEFELRPFGD